MLSQAGFPEPAPKRWDDQMFENRLKQALQGKLPSAAQRMSMGSKAR